MDDSGVMYILVIHDTPKYHAIEKALVPFVDAFGVMYIFIITSTQQQQPYEQYNASNDRYDNQGNGQGKGNGYSGEYQDG